MTKKEFVPYEEALALKELGFNETCFTFYTDEQELYNSEGWGYNQGKNVLGDEVVAPLYQQAFRWFREEYNWMGWIDQGFTNTFRYNICENNESVLGLEGFETYEDAELACLRKLIETNSYNSWNV